LGTKPLNEYVPRDVIAREAHNFTRKAFDFFRGRQILLGDEVDEILPCRM